MTETKTEAVEPIHRPVRETLGPALERELTAPRHEQAAGAFSQTFGPSAQAGGAFSQTFGPTAQAAG